MTDYTTLTNEFLLRLATLNETKQLATVYGVSVADVIKRLIPYIAVNYFKDKSVKRIRINYTEAQSGINIFYSVSYKYSLK